MDNISHSVVGLATGELLHRSLPKEPATAAQDTRRRLLLIACCLASNFPDLDLLLSWLLPTPLGYLLYHRGHTHTIGYLLPQACFLIGLLYIWPATRRLLKQSAVARIGLCASILSGFILHLLMDYLNSYGIHPFYPFDARWLYGDLVFIVEPVLWITFGVPLAMMIPKTSLRLFCLTALIGIPLYFTVHGFLLWISLAILIALAITMAILQKKSDARGNNSLWLVFAVGLSFIGLQTLASAHAKHRLTTYLTQQDPTSRILDIAQSPFPANLLCWQMLSISRNDQAKSYRMQRYIVSLAPALITPSSCPTALAEENQQQQKTPAIALLSSEEYSLEKLRYLQQTNCHFNAWMRFARAPAIDDKHAEDRRFGLTRNFSTLFFDTLSTRHCAKNIPQWRYPRDDLLTP